MVCFRVVKAGRELVKDIIVLRWIRNSVFLYPDVVQDRIEPIQEIPAVVVQIDGIVDKRM